MNPEILPFLGVGILLMMSVWLIRFHDFRSKPEDEDFDHHNQITPKKYGRALYLMREFMKIIDEDGGPQNSYEEKIMDEAKTLLIFDMERIKK